MGVGEKTKRMEIRKHNQKSSTILYSSMNNIFLGFALLYSLLGKVRFFKSPSLLSILPH